MKKSRRSKRSSGNGVTARTADKYLLYEQAVQYPPAELDFVDRVFKKIRGRAPRLLREDFCGSALVCCDWVRRHPENTAVGIDIDPKVLRWGEKHNVSRLSKDQAKRLRLLNRNVLSKRRSNADAILAMNFSYWLFLTRADLLRYFQHVRGGLATDGIFFLDVYGGYESHMEEEEERECEEGFTYVWEQANYNPISGCLACYIHFRFPDGSAMERAFKYRWRIWNLPEIRELLYEAGFSKVTVYWEGTDRKTLEGNGVFRESVRGSADASWVAYVTACG